MANRYWRGGAGTWDTTTTTNWSTSSGGAGGASVPTAADSVFFDQAGTYTVTCTGALTCLDITVSAGTVTFANGTSPTWTIAGSVSLVAATVWSATGTKTFTATTAKTITTNGVTFNGACTFDGVGGSWTLGSALNIGGSAVTITNGTFDTSSTGNYSVTASNISSNNTNTRTINLNGSTITLSASGGVFSISSLTGLTFNAGTSQINISSNGASVDTAGITFYNLSFTNTAGFTRGITGANTFNNLTSAGRTSAGICIFTIGSNQTINGTLTLNAGTAASYRTMLASNTVGTQRTLTCAAISSVTDIDFRDINFAGAISLPVTGTRLGDCGGNSNITFPAAKTVYYRQTGSASWGATGSGSWSATSGGALDATQFPLAQDTAVFPAATYPASGSTTTINADYNIGTIDMSLRTSNTMTLATSASSPSVYGNWINGTGITISGTATITFSSRSTQQITSAGIAFTQTIVFNSTGTTQLQDAFTTGASVTTTLTRGTLDLQSFTLSTGLFNSSNSNIRTIAFGTGQISCTGTGNAWSTSANTNLTVTGTGTINVTNASAKTFAGGGFSYSGITINQGGAGALTITGSNTFSNITNTYKSTGATSILFIAGTTNTFTNWNASGESTRLLTIGSATAASHTLSKASGTVSSDYLSISRSTATGGASWYAGANSTDGGNNSGWIFTAPPSGAAATGNFLMFFQ